MSDKPAKKRLSLTDQAFLILDSPEVSSHVGCLATFSRPPGSGPEFQRELVADLKAARTFAPPFNFRLSRSPLSKLAPAWETVADEEIDLDYHFRHSALPWPGGERELGVLVSRLHSRPLDPTKPLWECHLIEGLAAPGESDGSGTPDRFALYFKVHHALMDGVRGMRLISRMLSADPDDVELRPLWTIGRKRRLRSVASVRAPLAGIKQSARLIRGLVGATGDIVREAVRPTDPAIGVPFKAPASALLNSRVSRQRRVATQTYEFERVRAVAKAAEATVNDVFLAVCAGALRRYLDELGVTSEDLVTGAPVSIRRTPEDDRSNAIAFVTVKLYGGIADPVERVRAIHRSAKLAKERLFSLPDEVVDQYAILTNGPFLLQSMTGLAGRVRPPYNLVISNVPGPIEPQYLRGARLAEAYPLSMVMHGQTLNITVFSTAGRFNVGFVGCRDRLPHMQRLAVYAGEELDELEAAVGLSTPGGTR